MKKILSVILAGLMLMSLSATALAASTQSYSDVPTSHWAFSNIESCRAKGLMQGTGSRLFDPEARLNRAQVAQICYNAYKTQLTNSNGETLADVPSNVWYYAAINWMTANDLVSGTVVDGSAYYYPTEAADRGHVALALYRLADSMGVTLPKTMPEDNFPDIAGLQPEYQTAISALQQAGVISGFPDGFYRPNEPLTRGQAAKLMDTYSNIPGLASLAAPIPPEPEPAPAPAPTQDPDFFTEKTFDVLYDYAVSLDYRPTCNAPAGGNLEMHFRPNNRDGGTWMVSIILWNGADNWIGRARLGDGVLPEDDIPLYSIVEMKAFLAKYAT